VVLDLTVTDLHQVCTETVTVKSDTTCVVAKLLQSRSRTGMSRGSPHNTSRFLGRPTVVTPWSWGPRRPQMLKFLESGRSKALPNFLQGNRRWEVMDSCISVTGLNQTHVLEHVRQQRRFDRKFSSEPRRIAEAGMR